MGIRLGQFFFRYRNAIGPVIFLFALLIGTPRYPFGRPDLNFALDLAGVALALLGQALRIATIGYEYIERGGRNRQVYASKLIQGGIFAHCRNPLYVGNILLAAGIGLVVNSTGFYLIVWPFVALAYISIVAAEEAFLREKFGQEYADYCMRVNRWIPRWQGWSETVRHLRFNWRRVLVKEYNTVFVVVLAITGVKLWSDYEAGGAATLPSTALMATGFGVWLAAYVFVRNLKKSGHVKA